MTAKIKLNAASGGGSFSLQAPSSSSNNRVISLPDIADGTLLTDQSSIASAKLSGNLPALNGSALTNLPTSGIFGKYAILLDSKTEGSDGGTFTANQWQVRDLTTEYFDPDGIVALDTSTSIFVLQAGYYLIRFSAPARRVDKHKAVLFRESGTQTIFANGSSEDSQTTDNFTTRSFGVWRGQISGTVNLQIRHRCTSTRANNGLGHNVNAGDEIYTIVEIFKEA